MLPSGLIIYGGASGTVTVSGATISHTTVSPDNPLVRLEFRQDGTVWKTEGTTETQLSAATDWIDPKVGMRTHRIRFTNLLGDTPGSSTAAVDVWHLMNDGDFHIQYTRLTEGFNSGTFDIAIALDISNPRGSGSYTMTATKNP